MPDKKWASIPSWEVHNSRREWMDKNLRLHVSVLIHCAWDDRWKLLIDLYTSGSVLQWADTDDVIYEDTVGSYWKSIYWPRAFPDAFNADLDPGSLPDELPKNVYLGVESVEFESPPEKYTTDAAEEVIETATAFMRVQYGTTYNIEDQLEFETEYITVDHHGLTWENGGGLDPDNAVGPIDAPAAILHQGVLTRTIKGVNPNEVIKLIHSVGKTNSVEYSSTQLGIIFPPQSLLMQKPVVVPARNFEGLKTTSLTALAPDTAPDIDEYEYPSTLLDAGMTIKVKFKYKAFDWTGSGQTPAEYEAHGVHNYFYHPAKNSLQQGQTTSRGEWNRLLMPDGSGEFFRPYKPLELVDRFLSNRPQLLPVLADTKTHQDQAASP